MRASVSSPHASGLLARIVATVTMLKTVWERRRLVGQMASFDDHMLRDIGLTRHDIASALADPGLSDPTLRLALRAHDARANHRAVALEQRQWARLLGADVDLPVQRPKRRAA